MLNISPEAIEKAIDDVGKLQKENKLLKRQVKELNELFERSILMGYDDQITRLSERIDKLSGEYNDLVSLHFIWMQRRLGEFIIVSTLSLLSHLLTSKKMKSQLEQIQILHWRMLSNFIITV